MIDKTKLQHFRNLVSLSIADGTIKEIERTALTHIATELEIPLDRLEVMLSHADEYVFLIPQNNEEREKQLREMVELALIDGEFAVTEYELIQMVAEKLGFTKEELDHTLETKFGIQKIK